MAHWEKEPLYKVKYNRFTFHYDTATELGRMAFESGSKMPNPYDPINSEYDEYGEAYVKARDDYVQNVKPSSQPDY